MANKLAKFDGWSIFTDVDGTISTWDYKIPQNNLDAIKYFTENGGKFTVATGRGYTGIGHLTCLPYINLPCILSNGAVVYDYIKQETISFTELPAISKEIARTIIKQYPELRVIVWAENNRYEIGARTYLPPDSTFSTVDEIEDKWTKLVIYVEAEERESFIERIRSMADGKIAVTSSSVNFVEVMPCDITKGSAVEHIIEQYRLDRSKVMVIGDFFNDLEMLTIEGINAYCPENAHDEIKKVCKKTLCSVDEGTIAELVSLMAQTDRPSKTV